MNAGNGANGWGEIFKQPGLIPPLLRLYLTWQTFNY